MARITIDENKLTIGDLEDFEDVTGESLTKALKPVTQRDENGDIIRDDEGRPVQEVEVSARVLKAIVWIASRKDDPDFTLEDARNVAVTSLEVIEADESGESENADPKD